MNVKITTRHIAATSTEGAGIRVDGPNGKTTYPRDYRFHGTDADREAIRKYLDQTERATPGQMSVAAESPVTYTWSVEVLTSAGDTNTM